jgi:hypothetical protein
MPAPAVPAASGPSGPVGDAAPSSPGAISGTEPFNAFIHVQADSSEGTQRSDIPVVIDIQLGRAGAPVVGANVVAGSVGKAMAATVVGAGQYRVAQVGYSQEYEITIETPGAALRDVRLHGPNLHTVSLSPHPKSGQPAEVRWSPADEAGVDDAELKVFGWDQRSLTYDTHVSDTGKWSLPAAAFPSATTFVVQVRRGASLTLAMPDSAAIVDITSSAETLVR